MYAQKKIIDNVHIVRERDRQRFRELLAVLGLGIPIGLFLLLFTWQNLEVIRLGHEATRLQTQRKDIEDANKSLQLELDRLTSLDAVEKKATALGFEATDPRSVVMVDKPAFGGAQAPAAPEAVEGGQRTQSGSGGVR
jgi:cell division protein FtsL